MKIIASAGHGEYWLPELPGVSATILWQWQDTDSDPDPLDWVEKTGLDSSEMPDCDLSWEIIVAVEGEPAAIVSALGALLVDLSFTPGADDGTFDYWPSGMRLARTIIDQLGPQYPYNTEEYGDIASRGGANGLLRIWEAVARHIILDKDELGYERADQAYELFVKIGWDEEAEKHKP